MNRCAHRAPALRYLAEPMTNHEHSEQSAAPPDRDQPPTASAQVFHELAVRAQDLVQRIAEHRARHATKGDRSPRRQTGRDSAAAPATDDGVLGSIPPSR